MKKLAVILLIFIHQYGMAMNDSDSTKIRYSLGVTTSAILNVVPAVQLSHDVYFSELLTFGLETGYIFSHTNMGNENTRGLRLRPQLKFTIHERNNFNFDLYLFYNYRYYKADRVVEMVKGNGAYIEEERGERKTTFSGYGLGFDLGFSEVDSFLKKINIGLGLGYGNHTNEYSNPMFEPENFIGFDSEGTNDLPILILHISLFIL